MGINGVNPVLADEFIRDLKKVNGVEEFLRETMSSDVKRYFNATTALEQAMIKGAYFRMKYLLTKLQKVEQKPEKKAGRQLKIGRYAK